MKTMITAAALAATAGVAFGQEVVVGFQSADSTATRTILGIPGATPLMMSWGDTPQFFALGDKISETFTGTGLTELNTARFQFEMYNGTLGVISSFDVMVNNTNVGNFVLSNPGVQTYDLTFDNLAVAGAGSGDDYTLEIVATSAIPFGAGGWNFRAQEGIATLTQVPTPGAAALLGLGGLVAGARRRR